MAALRQKIAPPYLRSCYWLVNLYVIPCRVLYSDDLSASGLVKDMVKDFEADFMGKVREQVASNALLRS